MSLFVGHKRDHDDESGQSANFKKLKGDLGALFGMLGSNNLIPQHNTVVSFRELTTLDDKACNSLVEILKTHGYHKVRDMPPDFVSACGNLYSSCKSYFTSDDNFKKSRFVEKELETGYRKMKDREGVFFRKGYHIDDQANTRGLLTMDAARDLQARFEQYYAESNKVAHVILQAIVKGLGGSPEQARNILPLSNEHNSLSTNVARAFHYFDTPVHTVICPPHHDLGLLTLIPANFPGLQVYSLCSCCGLGWESTHKSLDSTDVVVIGGESLNEFAGGLLSPGLHRVVSEKPLPLAFSGFPFSPPSSSTALTTTTTTSSPPTISSLTSPSPSSPPTGAAAAQPKKGRAKKAADAAAAATQSLSAAQMKEESRTVGRISLPFLLRARVDVKLDGTLLGLRPTRLVDKSAGQFFEEERMKKGGGVGLY